MANQTFSNSIHVHCLSTELGINDALLAVRDPYRFDADIKYATAWINTMDCIAAMKQAEAEATLPQAA